MLDLAQLTGIVFNCIDRKDVKNLKSMLVELACTVQLNEIVLVNGIVCKGPGETTSAMANFKLPLADEGFIRSLRDVVKTIGNLDCDCRKIVAIIADHISKDFEDQLTKLIKIGDAHNYDVEYFIFKIGPLFTSPLVRHELVRVFEVNDFEIMKQELRPFFKTPTERFNVEECNLDDK